MEMPQDLPERVEERLDPDGEQRSQIEALKSLNTPLARGILSLLGVDSKLLDEAANASLQAEALRTGLVQQIRYLPELGWVPSGAAPSDAYNEAARLAGAGDAAAAAELIIAAWNSPGRIRQMVQRVKSLGIGSDKWRDLFMERWELLDAACQLHEKGRYNAAIPIVLAQLDGITHDVTGRNLSFYERNREHLEDEESIAGMPEALPVVASTLSRRVSRTQMKGQLSRHGILHGRELSYGTLENSTKCFATLFALVEWAQPQMKERIALDTAVLEAKYAGSDKKDADGRRMDRRGF